MAPSISRVSPTFFASARPIYMQFTGFSKAFMTGKRPADGSSLRFSINVAETATHCQNQPALPRQEVASRAQSGLSAALPTRPRQGGGESTDRRNSDQSADRNMTADIDCGFQNAATLL
jgi:hypothetical protein